MFTERGSPKTKKSLQRQMTLTLSGVIIGMIILVGLPMILISVRIQRQESDRAQQEMADKVAKNLASILQSLQTNQFQMPLTDLKNPEASFVATEIGTILNLAISHISAQVQEAVQNQAPLETLFDLNPQLQGLQQFTAQGEIERSLWRDRPLAAVTIQPSRESLQLTQQGINTQDAFFFDDTHRPILVVATSLISDDRGDDEDGLAKGLMLAWVTVPGIWPYLTDLKIGKTGYLYIIDQQGRLVTAPNHLLDQTVPPDVLLLAQSNASYQGLGGEWVQSKISPIENTLWQVVTELPVTEANDSLRSLLIILLAILLFGISLAISIARLFSSWILQPIHTLQQSATRISKGDLSHRITLERDDELGFLARAFNQMVATLEQTINELRMVSLNLLSAQEMERRRIAQEIHDELGQTLTALRLNLWLRIQANPENKMLVEAHQQATNIQEQARTLSHELRPAMLDDLGLLPTLEWYIDRIEQRANLAIILEAQFDENCLHPNLKTTLYRLIAEALTNITKHAQASVVEIKLNQNDHELTLTIIDDGVGFQTSTLAQTHSLGIAGMRERVNLLQGTFLIKSKPDQGTQLFITLPLQAQETQAQRSERATDSVPITTETEDATSFTIRN